MGKPRGPTVAAPGGMPAKRPGCIVIFRQTVKHWRTGKEMRRKDGKPFVLGWPLVKLCWRRYREHVFAGLKKLFTGKPLLAAKSLLKASGVLHSRTLKGPP